MEPRFKHDFNHVRVHTDAKASDAASAIGARAFTAGRDIVFGAGEFAPQNDAGRRLLSHELAHVVQQAGPTADGVILRQPKSRAPDEGKHRKPSGEKGGPNDATGQEAFFALIGPLIDKSYAAPVHPPIKAPEEAAAPVIGPQQKATTKILSDLTAYNPQAAQDASFLFDALTADMKAYLRSEAGKKLLQALGNKPAGHALKLFQTEWARLESPVPPTAAQLKGKAEAEKLKEAGVPEQAVGFLEKQTTPEKLDGVLSSAAIGPLIATEEKRIKALPTNETYTKETQKQDLDDLEEIKEALKQVVEGVFDKAGVPRILEKVSRVVSNPYFLTAVTGALVNPATAQFTPGAQTPAQYFLDHWKSVTISKSFEVGKVDTKGKIKFKPNELFTNWNLTAIDQASLQEESKVKGADIKAKQEYEAQGQALSLGLEFKKHWNYASFTTDFETTPAGDRDRTATIALGGKTNAKNGKAFSVEPSIVTDLMNKGVVRDVGAVIGLYDTKRLLDFGIGYQLEKTGQVDGQALTLAFSKTWDKIYKTYGQLAADLNSPGFKGAVVGIEIVPKKKNGFYVEGTATSTGFGGSAGFILNGVKAGIKTDDAVHFTFDIRLPFHIGK